MALSSFERETIINWNPGEDMASFFTAEPRVWARIERLTGFRLIRTERIDGEVVGKEFEFPRSYIRFGKNGPMIGPPRTVSQRQREQGEGIGQEKRGTG
ncbi:MAG: hypothetical protein ACYSWY_10190 [Planctomycetota bacterium]